MAKTCGVYKITNIENGKVYIGSSNNIEQRKSTHFSQLRTGHHHSRRLLRDWYEYGEVYFTFEVIEVVEDEAKLGEREEHFIREHDALNGYNVRKYCGAKYITLTQRFDVAFISSVEWHKKENRTEVSLASVYSLSDHPRRTDGRKRQAEMWAEQRGFIFPMKLEAAQRLSSEIFVNMDARVRAQRLGWL